MLKLNSQQVYLLLRCCLKNISHHNSRCSETGVANALSTTMPVLPAVLTRVWLHQKWSSCPTLPTRLGSTGLTGGFCSGLGSSSHSSTRPPRKSQLCHKSPKITPQSSPPPRARLKAMGLAVTSPRGARDRDDFHAPFHAPDGEQAQSSYSSIHVQRWHRVGTSEHDPHQTVPSTPHPSGWAI